MKKPAIKIFSLIISLLLTAVMFQQAFAAPLSWQSTNGPYGGDATAVAIASGDSKILYAGVYGNGVYQSIDGGNTWISISAHLPNLYVEHIVLNKNDIYAVTYSAGIYKSSDQGGSWVAVNEGLPHGTSDRITVADLVVSQDTLYASTFDGVYKSSNNGANWTKTGSFPGGSAQGLEIEGSIIYAGTYDSGIYKSEDGGKTWAASSNGLPLTNVTDIIKVDGVLYAGGPNYAAKAPGSLYKSNDGGHTWFGAYAGMSNSGVNSLVAQGSTIYAATPAGIYKTSNGGLNWVGINTGLASAYGYFITADGSMLYLGTQSGVYRSDNQGSNWLASSNGINGYWVNTMLSANTNLYAATPVGLYKSADNGLNWSLINAINIKQGALVADANNVLYALANNGVNKSTNQGQSWQLLTPPNSTNGYPVSASALSSLLIRNNTIYLSAYYEGVYQSNDGGISWQRFGQSTLATIRSMAIVGNNFYFTTGSYTSKTSLDGKQAWISINLPYGTYTNVLVGVENGTDNGILYGLTNQGIYVTTNAGATWTKTSLPSVNVTGLYISGNTYIASTGNGTYVSTNAGNTWALDNEGLNLSSNVYTVVGNQDFLFAGTMAGVYRSTVPTNQ